MTPRLSCSLGRDLATRPFFFRRMRYLDVGWNSPSSTLASRGALSKTPPSAEVSRCLALIPGKAHDSGLSLGSDSLAVLRGVKKGLLGILGTGLQIRGQG
jgi:hypothetical protein